MSKKYRIREIEEGKYIIEHKKFLIWKRLKFDFYENNNVESINLRFSSEKEAKDVLHHFTSERPVYKDYKLWPVVKDEMLMYYIIVCDILGTIIVPGYESEIQYWIDGYESFRKKGK